MHADGKARWEAIEQMSVRQLREAIEGHWGDGTTPAATRREKLCFTLKAIEAPGLAGGAYNMDEEEGEEVRDARLGAGAEGGAGAGGAGSVRPAETAAEAGARVLQEAREAAQEEVVRAAGERLAGARARYNAGLQEAVATAAFEGLLGAAGREAARLTDTIRAAIGISGVSRRGRTCGGWGARRRSWGRLRSRRRGRS
jgi:hypothetical protein